MKNGAKIKLAVYKLYNAADRLNRYIQTDDAEQSEIRDFLSIITEYALLVAAELSPEAIEGDLKDIYDGSIKQ